MDKQGGPTWRRGKAHAVRIARTSIRQQPWTPSSVCHVSWQVEERSGLTCGKQGPGSAAPCGPDWCLCPTRRASAPWPVSMHGAWWSPCHRPCRRRRHHRRHRRGLLQKDYINIKESTVHVSVRPRLHPPAPRMFGTQWTRVGMGASGIWSTSFPLRARAAGQSRNACGEGTKAYRRNHRRSGGRRRTARASQDDGPA